MNNMDQKKGSVTFTEEEICPRCKKPHTKFYLLDGDFCCESCYKLAFPNFKPKT